jgi:hypothetical protein
MDTIRSVLGNHGRRADADVTLLIEPDGRLIASTLESESGAGTGDYAHMLDAAEEDDAAPATLTIGGDAYQMITVPLRAPVTVAWVSMGFRINDELAAKLKSLTGLEVSIPCAARRRPPRPRFDAATDGAATPRGIVASTPGAGAGHDQHRTARLSRARARLRGRLRGIGSSPEAAAEGHGPYRDLRS